MLGLMNSFYIWGTLSGDIPVDDICSGLRGWFHLVGLCFLQGLRAYLFVVSLLYFVEKHGHFPSLGASILQPISAWGCE